MGVPFPGETALLAGSIYAATIGQLNIVLVIAAAATGAILGDNIGYAVGHYGGYPLLLNIMRRLHIDATKLGYAQRYFERHGDATVFFGRYFSVMRAYVAFLAGVNRMPWQRFLFWNALGGICWAVFYGVLAYVLGHNVALLGKVLHVLGIGGIVAIAVFTVAVIVFIAIRRRRGQRKRTAMAPPSDVGSDVEWQNEAAAPDEREPTSPNR